VTVRPVEVRAGHLGLEGPREIKGGEIVLRAGRDPVIHTDSYKLRDCGAAGGKCILRRRALLCK